MPPLAVASLILLWRGNPYWKAAAWGLVMLLSMDGWGGLVQRLLRTSRPIDLGLRLIWGAAATLGIGGVACALHLAARPFLLGQVIVGALLSLAVRVMQWRPAPSRRRFISAAARPNAYLVFLATLAPVAVDYLGEIGDPKLNLSDDPPFYFYLAEKILQTGTPFDPFLSRRVATLSGEDFLNAQFLVLGRADQLNVVDGGVGALLLLALIIGAVAPRVLRRANAGHLAVPLLLFLVLGECRINVASLLTGAAAFFGVYRTVLWMDDEAPASSVLPIERLALLAAGVVATCVLRVSNAVPVAAFAGLAVIGRHIRPSFTRAAVLAALRDVAVLSAACVVLLLPWLLVSRESTGALIYPLDKGNATPGFDILKAESGLAYNLKHIVENLAYGRPVATSLLMLTAGMLPLGWGGVRSRTPRDFVALLAVVCVCALLLVSYMGGGFEDWVNSRYYYAVVVATTLAIAVSIVPRRGIAHAHLASPRALLVVAAVVAQAVGMRDTWAKTYLSRIDIIERARTKAQPEQDGQLQATQKYQDLQAHVPQGESMAVIVNEPYRFDMKRNQVYFLDIGPGGLGPKPGFPVFKGSEALASYFLDHRIRYLVVSGFHDRINIDTWRSELHKEHSYLGYEAPIVVDTLESLEKLEQTRRVVYESAGTKVIDLGDKNG